MGIEEQAPPWPTLATPPPAQEPPKRGKENSLTVGGLVASAGIGAGISATSGISNGLPVGIFLSVIVMSIRILAYIIQFAIEKLADEVNRQGEVNTDLRAEMEAASGRLNKEVEVCKQECQKIRLEFDKERVRLRSILRARNKLIVTLAFNVKELGGDIDPSSFMLLDDNTEKGFEANDTE